MSDFTPKNDILNLSPSPSKTSSNNAFNKTSEVKGNGKEINEKENHTNLGNDTESFLTSLIKSIDETNQFLPDHMKISQKEVVNEAMNKLQQGSFDENDKISIFESVSFMQILSMLDKLKIDTSDVKLANLSNQLSTLVKTEANLNALKGAKNLSELLDIAKDMDLNVKHIKVDRLLDLKATFPNLDKVGFFKGAVDNVFKEVIKNKIANINKNLNHLNQQNTYTTNIKNSNNENNISLLSKTLQNLDSIISDKKSELSKNKNAEHGENKTNLAKDLTKNIKHDENLVHLKETNEDNKQEKSQNSTTKNNTQEPILKTQNSLNKKDFKENQTQIKEDKHLKTQKLEQEKTKNEDKNTFVKNETKTDKTKILDKNDSIKNITEKEITKKEFSKEVVKEIPKESPKEEKNLNPKETLKEFSKEIPKKEDLNQKSGNKNIKNSNPLQEIQNLNANKENIQTKNTITSVQNLQNKDILNQNTQNITNNNANTFVKENTTKEHKNSAENKLNINIEQKLNTELLKNQSINAKNDENFSDLNNKENNRDFNENTQNRSQKDNNLEDLNSLLKDLSKVSQNQSKNQITPKETLQHFSQDLKEAMANYKAPITKLSITLNPSNLGEVEVTLVQRGSNLHINFNSNTNAMNLFIQHQIEFKNSLVNMGFTGLEMNFSDQGKKEQNQSKSRSGYGFKEVLEGENESEKVNLELVLAKYF